MKASDVLDASLTSDEDAPVIRMVNSMMIEALKTKASDIHFEALEHASRLRYRIDGELVERPAPPKALHNAVVSRIKIMSALDIAERRKPQDGRFKIKAIGKEVDVRVSILPTVHGEKVVMRILDKANLAPGLASLGLDEYAYKAMKYAIEQPHGIILVTGPTGSGKTTTLYSCLQDLNTPNVNIITAEDPVEYELAGVNQVHVNTAVGLTFAGVLRSVLRQDPDIVLVGENQRRRGRCGASLRHADRPVHARELAHPRAGAAPFPQTVSVLQEARGNQRGAAAGKQGGPRPI